MFTAPVVDADADGPVPWLATAYVAGPSLADAVRDHGPVPARSVLALAAGLAEGLNAIHAAGLIHRDLKPTNVLLAEDGPRVIDFGISRAAEATSLTRADLVIGSPGFMSPEQAEGGEVGPASDVFSLGAVLAFAATGQGPFGAGSTAALVYRVVHGSPGLGAVPPEVRPLIERCLVKDPGQRPTTAELLAELDGTDLAAGWLPAPIAAELSWHAEPPDTADPADRAAAEPGPLTAPPGSGLPTVTAARAVQGPTRPRSRPAPPGMPGIDGEDPGWRRSQRPGSLPWQRPEPQRVSTSRAVSPRRPSGLAPRVPRTGDRLRTRPASPGRLPGCRHVPCRPHRRHGHRAESAHNPDHLDRQHDRRHRLRHQQRLRHGRVQRRRTQRANRTGHHRRYHHDARRLPVLLRQALQQLRSINVAAPRLHIHTGHQYTRPPRNGRTPESPSLPEPPRHQRDRRCVPELSRPIAGPAR